MAEQGAARQAAIKVPPIETRVEMVRQLAEALDHAHRRHLYHRALAARSVYVEMDGRYPRLRICDWQVAARPGAGIVTARTPCWRPGRRPRWPRTSTAPAAVPGARSSAARIAMPPSSTCSGSARSRYLILTGSRPRRLAQGAGPAGWPPSARSSRPRCARGSAPRWTIWSAARPRVQPGDRIESVRDFLTYLDVVEEELTAARPG